MFLSLVGTSSAGLLTVSKDRAQGDTLVQQANTTYQSGDYAGALRLLDQAEALKPDQADAWNLRGAVYLKMKAYDKAEAAFARSTVIDPTLWAAQFNVGEARFQKKDFARAQSTFEHLLAQTNRFKASAEWELVLYKSFLCALLSGNDADARKLMARIPAVGGATPALFYAQAAMAFKRNDATGARKILSGVPATFSPALNGIFTNSLETAGWQAPSVVLPASSLAAVNVDPATAAAMNAAGLTNPGGLALPNSPATGHGAVDRPSVKIDPRLVAAASEPLPAGPGEVIPVAGHAAAHRGATNTLPSPAAKPTPAATPDIAAAPPKSPLEQEGLLLGAD